jgi:hypothetical protein
MVKNTGRHRKKHILTGFFFGDRLLLWDSIVRERALRYMCSASCVELRGECSWWPVAELVQFKYHHHSLQYSVVCLNVRVRPDDSYFVGRNMSPF